MTRSQGQTLGNESNEALVRNQYQRRHGPSVRGRPSRPPVAPQHPVASRGLPVVFPLLLYENDNSWQFDKKRKIVNSDAWGCEKCEKER